MSHFSSQRGRLERLSGALDELAAASLRPWLSVGLDPEGGAYGFLDRSFQPVFGSEDGALGPSGETLGDQSLVQQARHLFSYSFMHERRPGDTRLKPFADEIYRYLRRGFGRRKNDGRGSMPPDSHRPRPLLHWVPRGGSYEGVEALADRLNRERGLCLVPPDPGGDFSEASAESPFAVQLYAQGFAAFALCTYALSFDVSAAATWARALFLTLDERRHDEKWGGYDQTADAGWLGFAGAPSGAQKCANTHIHLLEALTPLCRAFPGDPIITGRLTELAEVIATRMLQPEGYIHPFFARDFTPVGPPEVSYGHDIETSWLLMDALRALKESGATPGELERTVRKASVKMAQTALEFGWDAAGGLFESGKPELGGAAAQVQSREKVWWAQAEALPGIYELFRKEPSTLLLDKLEATFEFLSKKSWDEEAGEFFWSVDSAGGGRDVEDSLPRLARVRSYQ
jgi:mannose/cellobiose epimerase-like protein (N-acyl-D-glucosamine 2-epimerase family)